MRPAAKRRAISLCIIARAMNDALKWVLIALISAIAVFAGGEALGINWSTLQVSMLSFLQTVGLILLLFTGSAAAIEVAKYYRNKDRLEEEELSSSARHVGEGELQHMLQEAVMEALEMHQARQRSLL